MVNGKQKVVVGMSGGVDSSFAAAILKQDGYDVVGVMLNLWTEPTQKDDNRCCSLDSQYQARRVAAQLDIPFYVIDAKDEFHNIVVEHFINEYIKGNTPNPCVNCNANVRWHLLLETAKKFGIETIATGHYARIIRSDGDYEKMQLLKGLDNDKDQSYVLSMVGKDNLRKTLLPLGEYTKKQVRVKSKELGLISAERPDSQDLCFLGKMDYREFLIKYAGESIQPGEIVDEEGNILGRHEGLPFYTIGQKKKLRIANNHQYFVISKNISFNKLIVRNTKILEGLEFHVKNMNWLSPINNVDTIQCKTKIRYRSQEIPAIVNINSQDSITVKLNSSHGIEVTPGQIAAFYKDELCMGGGIIV
jgi:tRNA-uridine 2-sulfurtransferase